MAGLFGWRLDRFCLHRHKDSMRSRGINWKHDTDEGERIEIRAERKMKDFELSYKAKGDEEWTPIPKPGREYLLELRDLLDLRYRRRKGSLKEVEVAEQMISRL